MERKRIFGIPLNRSAFSKSVTRISDMKADIKLTDLDAAGKTEIVELTRVYEMKMTVSQPSVKKNSNVSVYYRVNKLSKAMAVPI